MIKTNASQIAKELEDYAGEMERKLTNMVRGYVTELAVTAINATPLGDSRAYEYLYQLRFKEMGLQPIEGLAQGAWTVVTNPAIPFEQNYGFNSDQAAQISVAEGLMKFKLGNTVYLGNSTPYIAALEDGHSPQAPDGITSIVMKAFKPDIVRYFKEG